MSLNLLEKGWRKDIIFKINNKPLWQSKLSCVKAIFMMQTNSCDVQVPLLHIPFVDEEGMKQEKTNPALISANEERRELIEVRTQDCLV